MQGTDQNKIKFWLGHISNWQKSAVGIDEYCQSHGLSKYTFYYWRKKLDTVAARGKKSVGLPVVSSAFVPVTISAPQAEPTKALSYLQDPRWLGEFTSALIRGLR